MNQVPSRSAPTVIAIGLDSADPAVLLEWAASGKLPNLAAIMARGTFGRITTPDGLGDDGVWPSFATCLPPGAHGRWYYRGIKAGSYEQFRFRAKDFKHAPFWHSIDAAGKRTVVIDVPKSPQVEMVHGVSVHDWRVHGIDGQPCSHPPIVAKKLTERFGIDKIDRPENNGFLCNTWPLSPDLKSVWLESLHQSIEDKLSVAEKFLADPLDLLLVVFKETHCVGHCCWPPESELAGIYERVDECLGRLLEYASPDTTFIVFSNLGMGDNFHGNDLLDTVLRRLERRLSPAWRNAVVALDVLYHRARNRLRVPTESSRYRGRLAYQLEHNEIAGAVRVNLKDREPSGRVTTGSELEEFYTYLESELLNLTNTATGKPAVDRVLRMDDEQNFSARHDLPDLLVIWSRDAPIESVFSPSVGVVKSHAHADRPGNHVPGGVYFALGPGIAPGEGAPADITDLGVTIAALLEVEVPGATGNPIESICSGDCSR